MDSGPFFAQFIEDYYAECDEHLSTIRRVLLELETHTSGRDGAVASVMNVVRRSLHTLKGLSAMVGLQTPERIAHVLEDVLRSAGPSPTSLDPQIIELLFDGARLLEQSVSASRGGSAGPPPDDLFDRAAAITAAPSFRNDHQPSESVALSVAEAEVVWIEETPATAGLNELYRFEFTPSAAANARGVTVESIRRRLSAIGDIRAAVPRVQAGGRVVFDFTVALHADQVPDEAWRADGLTWEHAPPAVNAAPRRLDIRPDAEVGPMGNVAAPSSLVRVDLARLEDLMRGVGELVVSRSRLSDALRRAGNGASHGNDAWEELQEANTMLERQLRALRDNVMRIRLVRVGELFERLRFAVRDLAREAGREITFELDGQDTEVDKAIVDRMLEPLMHLVRNAVSHGLEDPDDRRAAGKPAAGTLSLRAFTSGDRISVVVEDDGRGIDEAEVRHRARATERNADGGERGETLLDILCRSGFSTRSAADRSSGRGMGMAIVRSTIRELGGALTLQTEPGQGTRFVVELPLTLMIVDALIVDVADQQMAVPQPVLREIVQVEASSISTFENNAVVSFRSSVLPLISLRDVFNLPHAEPPTRFVLVVGSDAELAGLVVDRIVGLREIVVHPITDPLLAVPGVGGATELGNGRVILILDAAALVRAGRPARTRAGTPARQLSAAI